MFARSLALLSSIGLGACGTIVFDGRVPATAKVADFDSKTGIFDPQFTKGQNVTFSSLVRLNQGCASLFDAAAKAQPVEVTIDDKSIFAPGGSAPQTAVRRAELMPNPSNTNANTTSSGIKTLHVSLKPSADRPLNTSHEYLMVFMERADFGANLIALKTGTLIGSDGASKDDLVLLGNTADGGGKVLFRTPFVEGAFTNLGVRMDFGANTVQIFSSTGMDPLVMRTDALPNDLSGNGALHFGLNKNPINPGADSLRTGIQEAGILEGVVYGGIFMEDSADGSVTLS